MPAGQTPHTVILFAHNDLVDAVQPGDRYVFPYSHSIVDHSTYESVPSGFMGLSVTFPRLKQIVK